MTRQMWNWVFTVNIWTSIPTQRRKSILGEGMAGHLGHDMGSQSAKGLAQQMFQVASDVLDFVKGSLDPCAQAVEPGGRIWRWLA